MYKKLIMLLLITAPLLWANYEIAMEKYREKAYDQAIPMLEKERARQEAGLIVG